jgi:hypothetical protein
MCNFIREKLNAIHNLSFLYLLLIRFSDRFRLKIVRFEFVDWSVLSERCQICDLELI